MYHVLKVGDRYLTADGTLSSSQGDALRLSVETHSALCDIGPRVVRVRPKTSSDTVAEADTGL